MDFNNLEKVSNNFQLPWISKNFEVNIISNYVVELPNWTVTRFSTRYVSLYGVRYLNEIIFPLFLSLELFHILQQVIVRVDNVEIKLNSLKNSRNKSVVAD